MDPSNDKAKSTYIFDTGYGSLNPPSNYQTPAAIKSKSKILEPKIKVITSLRFLKDYETSSEEMAQAKAFWLSYKVDDIKNKRPEQYSSDPKFLEAAEFLRKEVWKWHVFVFYEDTISLHFNRETNDICQHDKIFPDHLYIHKKGYNRANVKINRKIKIDKNFLSLKDYKKLEKNDHAVVRKINLLPPISKGIKKAKKYWSSDISQEEARSIYQRYPNEVERIRVLLWKRHLIFKAERAREKIAIQEYNKEINQKLRDLAIKCASIGSASMAVVSLFFSQAPLLLVSSIALIGIITVNSYFNKSQSK